MRSFLIGDLRLFLFDFHLDRFFGSDRDIGLLRGDRTELHDSVFHRGRLHFEVVKDGGSFRERVGRLFGHAQLRHRLVRHLEVVHIHV